MIKQDIQVAADAMVFSKGAAGLQLLLVKRKNDPDKGMWAIPGGFVEDDEELEAAAIRELEEETGLKLPAMTQLHTFGKVGRDPRGRTISVVYYAITDASLQEVKGADDAEEAKLVNVNEITELAFDHMEALALAMKKLADKVGADK
jgi:8-oxo-dGTP diphosphatase